jgi:hypothetical protein
LPIQARRLIFASGGNSFINPPLCLMVGLVLSIAALVQTEVTLELHRSLEGAAQMPVVISPDGASILYFKRIDDGQQTRFVYCLADARGENQRELYATPVDWADPLLALLGASPFSTDGRVAVATTLGGQGVRGEQPDKLRAGVIERDGRLTKIACELDQCTGFDFAGDRLVFIDSNSDRDAPRYQVKIVEKDAVRVLASGDRMGWSLRVSSDGRRAAWWSLDEPARSRASIRVVDLESGKTAASPTFRTESATFSGLPRFLWDAAGETLFAHVSLTEDGPRPFQLTRYNPFIPQGERAAPDNLAAVAMLDEGHLAVWKSDRRSSAALRVSDQRLFDLPAGLLVLGGRGAATVVWDVRANQATAATLRLPQ